MQNSRPITFDIHMYLDEKFMIEVENRQAGRPAHRTAIMQTDLLATATAT